MKVLIGLAYFKIPLHFKNIKELRDYSQTFLHEVVARSARLCWTHTQSASLMRVHSEL